MEPTDRARAQCCYTAAYFVIPRYAAAEPARLIADFEREPDYAAKFYYALACRAESREPDADELRTITAHGGRLDDRHAYHVVAFPKFPPVSLLHLPEEEVARTIREVVLAPYFAALVVVDGAGKSKGRIEHYFVLGQSPDGLTTLREVTAKMNANLGRGCAAELPAFVELLKSRLAAGADAAPPLGGVEWRSAIPARRPWWKFW